MADHRTAGARYWDQCNGTGHHSHFVHGSLSGLHIPRQVGAGRYNRAALRELVLLGLGSLT